MQESRQVRYKDASYGYGYDEYISATVPLGMFGVTEPCSKILRFFEYLEFLDFRIVLILDFLSL